MRSIADNELSVLHVEMEIAFIANAVLVLKHAVTFFHSFVKSSLKLIAINLAKDAFTPEEPAPETPAEPAPAAPAFDLSKPAEPEDAGDDGFDPVFPAINGAEKTPVDPEERFTIRPDVDTPEDEEAGAVHLTLDLPEKKSGQEDDAI